MSTETKMSEQEQRIACATELGWKWTSQEVWRSGKEHHFLKQMGEQSKIYLDYLPDPLHDANAALELVAFLAKKGWRCVANSGTDGTWECYFTQGDAGGTIPGPDDHYGAGDTLAQAIVEAALRVWGKWKEQA